VGERDCLPVPDRREHGIETVRPGRGAEHELDVRMRRDLYETVPACAHKGAVGHRTVLPQAIERLGGRHRDSARLIPRDLAGEAFGILAAARPTTRSRSA